MTGDGPGRAGRPRFAVVRRVVPDFGRLRGLLERAGVRAPEEPAGRRRAPGRAALREHEQRVTREWEALRERLASLAGERLADVGDLLSDARLEFTPDTAESAVRDDYVWAMEAFQAAGKVLDEAADLPDLAAAIVLADRAVERFAAAHTRHAGGRPAAPVTRCYYNPLHGAAERDRPASSRAGRKGRGQRGHSAREAAARRRPACGACRLAILAGQLPDALPALATVRVSRHHTAKVFVPYYTVSQADSLWSASCCGATDESAPSRVLRGEHRRGPATAR